MTDPQRRDWLKLLAEIKAGYAAREGKPLTTYKLGLMLHMHHTSVEFLLAGTEPKHFVGEMILALHAEYVCENSHSPIGQADSKVA